MPLKKLKYTYEYCRSNIGSFILVLMMIFLTDQINAHYYSLEVEIKFIMVILATCITLIFHGYGLVVTKDNIDGGISLPKLPVYKSFVFGIKSTILFSVYATIQYIIYSSVSIIFELPFIEMEEGKIAISNVNTLFIAHNGFETIIFFIFVIISIYVFTFFMEISLARLADKNSILDSLNVAALVKCINTIGWGHYAIDYTKLILAISILAYMKFGLNIMVSHPIIDLIIGLLIFIIQYIGIGRIYHEYKVKKYGNTRKTIKIVE